MGNAAFHSSELYGLLSECIQPLSAALLPSSSMSSKAGEQADSEQAAAEEKTRANAAGAVGNLIRLFVNRLV